MYRKAGLMALGVLCAMAVFGTGSASAATAYTCNFQDGLAGNINPGVGVLLGGGAYTFDGDADCTIGTEQIDAHISASGSFTNVICGTGLVTGSAVVSDNNGGHADITATFTIAFNATVGELVINTINGASTVAAGPGASGGGAVQITPKTGNCVDPVTEFTVTGAFAAAA
jgi:hypothetical protein